MVVHRSRASRSCSPGVGTPARYVTVAEDDKPVLRVDVYPYQQDHYPFQDAIVWRGNLIVGLGSYVHAISIDVRPSRSPWSRTSVKSMQRPTTYCLRREIDSFASNLIGPSCGKVSMSASTASSCARWARQLFEARASGTLRKLATFRTHDRRRETCFLSWRSVQPAVTADGRLSAPR